jgi:hypothetical protein
MKIILRQAIKIAASSALATNELMHRESPNFTLQPPQLEITARHSSFGGKDGGRFVLVKDASMARAGFAGATHP